MSTNAHTKENGLFLPSDLNWLNPWTLFMAAWVAVLTPDRSPVHTAVLGVLVLFSGLVCISDHREQMRWERLHQ